MLVSVPLPSYPSLLIPHAKIVRSSCDATVCVWLAANLEAAEPNGWRITVPNAMRPPREQFPPTFLLRSDGVGVY